MNREAISVNLPFGSSRQQGTPDASGFQLRTGSCNLNRSRAGNTATTYSVAINGLKTQPVLRSERGDVDDGGIIATVSAFLSQNTMETAP
jgi:hypothetical protein